MIFAKYGTAPCIAQVTSVDSPFACKLKSTLWSTWNGSRMRSAIVTFDAGAESGISRRPLPTLLLPSKA